MTTTAFSFCADDWAFLRRLWQLALPISLQAMMFSLLGLIDIFMVGQLGELAVAAVGLGNRISFMNLIVTSALGGGLSVLASQCMGANDSAGARRSLCQALLVSLGLNFIAIIAYMGYPIELLSLVSDNKELTQLARDYLWIIAPSLFCTALVIPLEAALRSAGDTRTPTRVGFYMLLVNVVLNTLFIFGYLGFPALGVAGSALGTALARLFQLIALVFYIKKHRRFVVPCPKDIAETLHRTAMARYLKVSVPLILQDGQWALGVLLYSLIYSQLGVDELAVVSAMTTVEGILMSLFVGFGVGCSIIIGQMLGAGQFERVWRYGFFVLSFALAAAMAVGLIIILLRGQLVGLLGQFDEYTRQLGSDVLIVIGVGLLLKVINFTGIIGLLRSGGDIKASLMINMISMWGVGLPLVWLAATVWEWPLPLVYVCSFSEEVVKAVLVLWRINVRAWMRNLVVDQQEECDAVII